MMAHFPRLLGAWPGITRPEPQPCPRCEQGWLWPLSSDLWFCPACGWLWPEEEKPTPRPVFQLPLALNGHGGRVHVPGPRRYVDRFGLEVLRRR